MNKKFKNCSLPIWTDEQLDDYPTSKWLYYLNNLEVNYDLYTAFSEIIRYGFIYHYNTSGNNTKEYPEHAHSYEEVLMVLYNYPISFNIPNQYLNEYSNQELKFIKRMKSFLKLIGLKDISGTFETEEELLSYKLHRCDNDLARKYSSYGFYEASKYKLKDILSGKKRYMIRKPINNDIDYYLNHKFLLINPNQDILGEITITESKLMPIDNLIEEEITLGEYHSLLDYQKALKEEYSYDPNFDNNILYLTYDLELFNK